MLMADEKCGKLSILHTYILWWWSSSIWYDFSLWWWRLHKHIIPLLYPSVFNNSVFRISHYFLLFIYYYEYLFGTLTLCVSWNRHSSTLAFRHYIAVVLVRVHLTFIRFTFHTLSPKWTISNRYTNIHALIFLDRISSIYRYGSEHNRVENETPEDDMENTVHNIYLYANAHAGGPPMKTIRLFNIALPFQVANK